ncbi:MAG: CSLREA domain-containing protein [Anaerolineae bacterium]|nr:CSLREA domain-containing protein [Anaerolineae bacterium]
MSKRTYCNQLKTISMRVTLLLFILWGVIILSTPKPAHALIFPPVQVIHKSSALVPITFQVNSMADPGDGVCDGSECTLREAVVAANTMPGANTILVPAGTHSLNVPNAGEDNALTGDLDITGDLVIAGDAANNTIIDANELGRVFHIAANVTVKLKDLTIQNGFAGDGGGIFNAGTLHLLNSTVTGNRTDYEAPEYGGNEGGGIYNTGTLYISSSQFTDNTTDRGMGDGGGGAIMNEGTLDITRSEFRANWAAGGGAVFNRGGQIALTDCKLFTNWARFFGGAIMNLNGGVTTISRCTISGNNDSIYISSGTILLLNSTVSNNIALRITGGINSFGGTVQVINSTITYNSSNGPSAGGISGYGSVTLAHSIVAHNSEINCGNIVTSLGYNLDSDGSCGLTGVGDLVADPLLGPLQNNGGQTPTYALLPGSPAIDAIPASLCLSPRDQRNVPRPQDGNGDNVLACDIGAFELRP